VRIPGLLSRRVRLEGESGKERRPDEGCFRQARKIPERPSARPGPLPSPHRTVNRMPKSSPIPVVELRLKQKRKHSPILRMDLWSLIESYNFAQFGTRAISLDLSKVDLFLDGRKIPRPKTSDD
jgi:hypothetical protein